jgi:hypothetical protein
MRLSGRGNLLFLAILWVAVLAVRQPSPRHYHCQLAGEELNVARDNILKLLLFFTSKVPVTLEISGKDKELLNIT